MRGLRGCNATLTLQPLFFVRVGELVNKAADMKQRFLKAYSDGLTTVAQAARKIGRDERTIRRWAANDEDFAKLYHEAQEEQHRLRLGAVEDALFQRILDALNPKTDTKISAALMIFWLKANGGEKYRTADHQYLHHSGGLNLTEKVDMEARVEHYRHMLAADPESGDSAAGEDADPPSGSGQRGADTDADA